MWSAFFTDRYENTAASRAFADFKAIKELLKNPGFTDAELTTVPALNRSDFPLADVDSLMAAGWPNNWINRSTSSEPPICSTNTWVKPRST